MRATPERLSVQALGMTNACASAVAIACAAAAFLAGCAGQQSHQAKTLADSQYARAVDRVCAHFAPLVQAVEPDPADVGRSVEHARALFAQQLAAISALHPPAASKDLVSAALGPWRRTIVLLAAADRQIRIAHEDPHRVGTALQTQLATVPSALKAWLALGVTTCR